MSVMLFTRQSWLWVAALLAALALPAISAPTVTVGGYLQARYQDTVGDTSAGTFTTNRVRLNVKAVLDEKVSGFIQYNLGTPAASTLKIAYVEYKPNTELGLRMGLDIIPFGYEEQVSNSRLITLERSKVMNAMMEVFTADRGVFAKYAPEGMKGLSVDACILNGQPDNVSSDTNNTKNVLARIGYAFPCGQIGISGNTGKGPEGQKMNRAAIDAKYTTGNLTLAAEGVTGKGTVYSAPATATLYGTSATNTAKGAYLLAAYQADELQPYLRYDTFNVGPGTNFNRVTVGANLMVAPNSKVTLEYQSINDDASPAVDSAFGAQYQIIF